MYHKRMAPQISGIDRGLLAMKNPERKRPRRTTDTSTLFVVAAEQLPHCGPPGPGGLPLDYPALAPTHSSVRHMLPPLYAAAAPTECLTTRLTNTSINQVKTPVHTVAYSPDGRRVITGNQGGEFTLWDGYKWNFETVFQAHQCPIKRMRFMPSGQYMLTGDFNGRVRYWTPGLSAMEDLQAHSEGHPVADLAFAPGDRKFATCASDGTVKVWDFVRRACDASLQKSDTPPAVQALSWHPHFALLASGGKDNLVRLWDLGAKREARALNWHTGPVSTLAFSPHNPHWLLSGGMDNTVRLTDLRSTREALATWSVEHKGITALAWHPAAERLFVTGSMDGSVAWWLEGKEYAAAETPRAHEAAVWDLAFSPTGGTLATVSNDFTTKFWTRARPGDDAAQYMFQGVEKVNFRYLAANGGMPPPQHPNVVGLPAEGGGPCVVVPGGPRLSAPVPVVQALPSVVLGGAAAATAAAAAAAAAAAGGGGAGGSSSSSSVADGAALQALANALSPGGGEGASGSSSGSSSSSAAAPAAFAPKVPHPSYICRKCNSGGHFIENCPSDQLIKMAEDLRRAGSEVPAEIAAVVEQLMAARRAGYSAAGAAAAAGSRPPPGPTYVCKKCGIPGHWVETCSAPSNFGGGGGAPGGPPRGPPGPHYVCHICQVAGDHWIQSCPQKVQRGGPGGGRR